MRLKPVLTGESQSPGCDPVVLVLLVGIGAPEPEAGEEGAEEVGDGAHDNEGGGGADVTWGREKSCSR